jgi:hypothetical protein
MLSGSNTQQDLVARKYFASYFIMGLAALLLAAPAFSESPCSECVALAELSCQYGCDSHKSRAVILKCARECAELRCEKVCQEEKTDKDDKTNSAIEKDSAQQEQSVNRIVESEEQVKK